jgi:hypothetical protein
MGVGIFFVLSGFLIGSQLLKPLAEERRALAGRLLPPARLPHPAGLRRGAGPVRTASALREAPGLEPWWKFAGFYMNLSIDYGRNQAFSHAWSLCVEEHFYLVFPALALALHRRISIRGFVLLVRRHRGRGHLAAGRRVAARRRPGSGPDAQLVRRGLSITPPGTAWTACWPACCWRR